MIQSSCYKQSLGLLSPVVLHVLIIWEKHEHKKCCCSILAWLNLLKLLHPNKTYFCIVSYYVLTHCTCYLEYLVFFWITVCMTTFTNFGGNDIDDLVHLILYIYIYFICMYHKIYCPYFDVYIPLCSSVFHVVPHWSKFWSSLQIDVVLRGFIWWCVSI